MRLPWHVSLHARCCLEQPRMCIDALIGAASSTCPAVAEAAAAAGLAAGLAAARPVAGGLAEGETAGVLVGVAMACCRSHLAGRQNASE